MPELDHDRPKRKSATVKALLAHNLAFALLFAGFMQLGWPLIPFFVIIGAMLGRLVTDIASASTSIRWGTMLTLSFSGALFSCLWDIDFEFPWDLWLWAGAIPILIAYALIATLIVQCWFWLWAGVSKIAGLISRVETADGE